MRRCQEKAWFVGKEIKVPWGGGGEAGWRVQGRSLAQEGLSPPPAGTACPWWWRECQGGPVNNEGMGRLGG